MRTTLSLDEDVASLLRQEMRRSGTSLKGAVNHFLRMGLMSASKQATASFTVTPRNLGLPPDLSYDCISDLLDNLEEETVPK